MQSDDRRKFEIAMKVERLRLRHHQKSIFIREAFDEEIKKMRRKLRTLHKLIRDDFVRNPCLQRQINLSQWLLENKYNFINENIMCV